MVVKGDTVINGKRIILFSSNEHLKILARSQQILGDGTFKITPSLWCQTFVISVQVQDSVFAPVAFCLLPDKKRGSYDAMFSMLKEALELRGLSLSGQWFMADFEVAIRDSFSSQEIAYLSQSVCHKCHIVTLQFEGIEPLSFIFM